VVSLPACQSVGPGFEFQAGTLGVPSLSKKRWGNTEISALPVRSHNKIQIIQKTKDILVFVGQCGQEWRTASWLIPSFSDDCRRQRKVRRIEGQPCPDFESWVKMVAPLSEGSECREPCAYFSVHRSELCRFWPARQYNIFETASAFAQVKPSTAGVSYRVCWRSWAVALIDLSLVNTQKQTPTVINNHVGTQPRLSSCTTPKLLIRERDMWHVTYRDVNFCRINFVTITLCECYDNM